MCYFHAWRAVVNYFVWNIPIYFIWMITEIITNHIGELWFLGLIPIVILLTLDAIPHPTTIGFWRIGRAGMFAPSGGMYVKGLLGEKRIDLAGGETIKAVTFGFIGNNLILGYTRGFCPLLAWKQI